MALHDWRVLDVATFFGQVRQDAATSEQVDAVKQIAALIREDTIHRIALDMDHARTGSTLTGHIPDGVEIDASGLAREMVDAGLTRFALVHRQEVEPWWRDLIVAVSDLGVSTGEFARVSEAERWLQADRPP